MARLVDVIEMMIKEMLDENNGAAVINRSDLAERVNCVPSQITYVISTRFTNGQGYIVESRRGGGGQIRISRVQRMPGTNYLMHTINSLGETISQQEAEIFLLNFVVRIHGRKRDSASGRSEQIRTGPDMRSAS